MTNDVEVYFSFRSPYSYLVTPELIQLRNDYNVSVNLRPVLPLAVRDPNFFNPDNIKRAGYIRLDWVRRAEFLSMPSRWPSPDPIVQDMETYAIAAEQPYIHRLTQLGVEAQRLGKGIEFAKEISHLIFSGTKDWHLGNHLADACKRIDCDLGKMDDAISKSDHADEVSRNEQQLQASQHWGVPTMTFRNEPFFGQDRIDTLRWRLDQHNLKR